MLNCIASALDKRIKIDFISLVNRDCKEQLDSTIFDSKHTIETEEKSKITNNKYGSVD